MSAAYGGAGPLLMGITWTEAGIATAVVAARAYSGLRLVRRVEWDLIWVAVSWAMAMAAQVALSLSAASGSGNHIGNLTTAQVVRSQEFSWIGQFIAIFAIGFGKIAVIALLLRIQGPLHRKKGYFLHFIWISNTILNISQTALLLTACTPYQRLWDSQLPGNCDKLDRTSHTGYLQGAWAAASDVVLATYPIVIFWSTSMSWQTKAGLCALMGGGYIVSIAAALKTVCIKLITAERDVTYAIVPLLIWAYTEQWLIIILGSIPQLRAFIAVLRSRRRRCNRAGAHVEDSGSEQGMRVGDGEKHAVPSTVILTIGSTMAAGGGSKLSTVVTERESRMAGFAPLEITVTTNYDISYENDRGTLHSERGVRLQQQQLDALVEEGQKNRADLGEEG